MLKFKNKLVAGSAALVVAAGIVAVAPAAQAETHHQWYNYLETCQRDTDARAKHYRNKGYHVSIQRYCRGEQYIGFMPQYESIIYYY